MIGELRGEMLVVAKVVSWGGCGTCGTQVGRDVAVNFNYQLIDKLVRQVDL